MDSAIKIFDEINDLYQEISDRENVKENIMKVLDDVTFCTYYIGYDLQSEKKLTKSLLGFSNGKIKQQNFYGMHQNY